MWSESSSHSVVSSSSVATSSMDDPLVVVTDGDPSRRRWITVDWEPDDEELLDLHEDALEEITECDGFRSLSGSRDGDFSDRLLNSSYESEFRRIEEPRGVDDTLLLDDPD